MSKKRQLSRRQRQAIQQRRKSRIAAAQQGEASLPDEARLGAERPGLVVAHYGKQVEVESLLPDDDDLSQRCFVRATVESVVVGDRVLWQPGSVEPLGVVNGILPRQNLLSRPDTLSATRQLLMKPVAANIDQILVVFAPLPEPSSLLLDRYLVAAAATGIPARLVMNKADLLHQPGVDTAKVEGILALYDEIGMAPLVVSAETGEGVEAFNSLLAGKTSIVAGQSGVGKSSLLNRLLDDRDCHQMVADISTGSGLGQHTTTNARLFHLSHGGNLIDSPGIREFGLWHLTPDQLAAGYPDIRELAEGCKFRDCQHNREPGCAVRQALEEGRLNPQRFGNFLALREEIVNAPENNRF